MWIDLTLPLTSDLPVWPGSIKVQTDTSIVDGISSTTIQFNLHTGTHIDAPAHAFPKGKLIHELDHSKFFSSMQIIDIGDSDAVTVEHVQDIEEPIVFFKTKNRYTSQFNENYCYISPEAAESIVSSNVSVVGIDYLSVENFRDKNFTTHKILLEKDIVIIEGLFLLDALPGKYQVIIIPLLIPAEASPARVFAQPTSL